MKYLMGIDNGGTFSKAAIFDENGKQIAVASEKTDIYIPKARYMERNLADLWEINARVIKNVILKSKIASEDIVGVSFSGHGKGLYLIGKDGKPLGNGILSMDSRAWKYVDKWNNDGTAKKVYEKTYQKILACQPVALLAFLRDNQKDIFDNIKYIFSVKDFIRYMLTDKAYGEYSDFSGGNLINFSTKNYDKELMKLFGLEEVFEALPPLRNASDNCGYITAKAAEQTGLAEGTPVAAGMFDIDACGVASGLSNEENLCMIAGTWSINEFISKRPVINSDSTLNSIFCMPEYYLIEESSPTSAGNMEWFIRNLMKEELKSEASKGKNGYELVNSLVESIEPDENDVYFLPYLNGSPEEVLAKGTFLGLTMAHTKAHMLRAVYEGIVFSHMQHLEKLLKNRSKPQKIQLSGGAANSAVWVQMFADVMQIPIEVVRGKELGAQGAAMAAGIVSGVYKNFPDAISKCVSFDMTINPREKYKAIYVRKYANYKRIVETLQPLWRKLDFNIN